MNGVGQLKSSARHRRFAGIVVAAGVTAACTASPSAAAPAASRPALRAFPAHDVACTTLATARAPVAGTSGPRSRLDMPSVPGGLLDVAARSPRSALVIGRTHTAILVA